MTVSTGTGWAEFELAREVAVGKSMTSEVATEPSCLVVVTNCVKTLGDVACTVADWQSDSQRRFE